MPRPGTRANSRQAAMEYWCEERREALERLQPRGKRSGSWGPYIKLAGCKKLSLNNRSATSALSKLWSTVLSRSP
jgi:hypothetical protein